MKALTQEVNSTDGKGQDVTDSFKNADDTGCTNYFNKSCQRKIIHIDRFLGQDTDVVKNAT